MARNEPDPPPTNTTASVTQYQQTGEDQLSHITEAAQLTRPGHVALVRHAASGVPSPKFVGSPPLRSFSMCCSITQL